MIKQAKKNIMMVCSLLFIVALFSLSVAVVTANFVGLYDSQYDRSNISRFPLDNEALHNFEQDKSLMQNMQVENYEGKIEYNTDSAYITNGLSSMKCTIRKNALSSKQTVKFKFDCGVEGKNIEQIGAINIDMFNENDFAIECKPVINSTFSAYYFDVVKLLPRQKTTVAITLPNEFKDTLSEMVGFYLNNLLKIEYRLILPLGISGETVVYMDNLIYTKASVVYMPKPAPAPMVREDGEVNNFNAPHTVKYTTPEYEVALAGYDSQNQFVKASYEETIKHEGAGALKFTIKGLDLGKNDASVYSYPALSFRRAEQMGATNLAKYNTLSFWLYYNAMPGSNGLTKNPDSVKFVFEHRNNYYPNGPEIVPDLIIPKHKWVNIKINLDDKSFGLRDYTTALRFWTYGFKNSEVDRNIYFDNITLSTDRLSETALNGAKYVLTVEQ